MDKLQQLKKQIEAIETKSLVSTEMKAFVKLVLEIANKNKDELANLSAENINTIQNAIKFIESENSKIKNDVTRETSAQKEELKDKLEEIKSLVSKINKIKPPQKGVDYFDGHNPSPEEVVPLVLKKLPKPVELKGEDIADKLEELKGDDRLDRKAIKGLDDLEKQVKSSLPKTIPKSTPKVKSKK